MLLLHVQSKKINILTINHSSSRLQLYPPVRSMRVHNCTISHPHGHDYFHVPFLSMSLLAKTIFFASMCKTHAHLLIFQGQGEFLHV